MSCCSLSTTAQNKNKLARKIIPRSWKTIDTCFFADDLNENIPNKQFYLQHIVSLAEMKYSFFWNFREGKNKSGNLSQHIFNFYRFFGPKVEGESESRFRIKAWPNQNMLPTVLIENFNMENSRVA